MINLAEFALTVEEKSFYHSGKPSRISQVPLEDREFIAWDGEGVNLSGPNLPQAYTLFGCSTGEHVSSDTHLHTFALLDFIIKIGQANPAAYHVGFAFNYDSNMILRSLSETSLRIIHEKNNITLRHKESGYSYYIDFLPGKWFSVTRRGAKYDRKKNPHDKVTVKIYDIFSFFGTSFIKAYTDLVGPVPDVVAEGKAARNDFASLTSEYIETYWRAEIVMLRELAIELRARLYGAGLRINQWHGPGALASYTLKKHGVKAHMAQCPDSVRSAASYGYAGGRFEMFKLGRTTGPIYSLDINSAYPYGIAQLPSLSIGEWRRVEYPTSVARFGIYRVRLLPRPGGTFLERAPGPLFHRDKMGNISFPWITEGWYWSPEVANLKRLKSEQYEIIEGWEYVGGFKGERPFGFVEEAYELRREWKRDGNASQLALKLMLNSLYGKMAQRVGWNEEKRTAPAWHQLEWAGWTTSNCRAMLWDIMSRIPRSELLAVETDGLYTTRDPATLGITNSGELGGWEVEVYDEILYVQSGMAWLRKGDKWICKRRGLDARTFSLDDCRDYLRTLRAGGEWAPYVGQTTRFIGLGAALAGNAPLKLRHCVWQTVDREIRPGQGGKRVHISNQCAACTAGASAWDMAHDMSIRSLAYGAPASNPHDIPWEQDEDPGYLWRKEPDRGEALI
jgi:hypothetical protein